MCELLALCFNQPVTAHFSFTGFQQRGKKNPDGWGFAFYPDQSGIVFKEPLRGDRSQLADFVRTYDGIRSHIFISHVRLSSHGVIAYRNTHPFLRELFGTQYIFAHNGTLQNYKQGLKLDFYQPIGETDSEYVFCWLLDQIRSKILKRKTWLREDFAWLHAQFRTINQLGSFNCLLSDGDRVFAYFDKDGYNGLKYLLRQPPYRPIRLWDPDLTIDLGEIKDPREFGVVIATTDLSNEGWNDFRPGQLVVVRNGQIIYSD